MALKSVLDIDVNDAAFQRFYALFQQYQQQVKQAAPGWEKVEAAVTASGAALGTAVTSLMVQSRLAHEILIAQGHNTTQAEAQVAAWKKLEAHGKAFAGHLANATRSILKWGTAAAGVLGVSAAWSIERSAETVAAGRRQAMGLGTTFGGLRSFGLNFGRFVDPHALLGGVSEALGDPSQRALFAAMGIRTGGGTEGTSVELLKAMKKLADRTPEEMLGVWVKALGLEKFGFGTEEMRRLKRTSPEEFKAQLDQEIADRKILDLSKEEQRNLADLNTQLRRAGWTIETAFWKQIAKLAEPLSHLSAAFTKLAVGIINSPLVEAGLNKLATWMEKLSNSDIDSLIMKLTKWGQDVVDWLEWFSGELDKMKDKGFVEYLFPTPKPTPAGPNSLLPKPGESGGDWWTRLIEQIHKGLMGPGAQEGPKPGEYLRFFQPWKWRLKQTPGQSPLEKFWESMPRLGSPEGVGGEQEPWGIPKRSTPQGAPGTEPFGLPTGPGDGPAEFRSLEQQYNLPGGSLDAIWEAESGRGRNMRSSAGALGHFQFMPATWQTYGAGGSPFDLRTASEAAAKYMHKLLVEFGGDPAKALAGYNWGEGNVERDIRQYGENWWKHLPRETEKYLQKILPHLRRSESAAPSPSASAPVRPRKPLPKPTPTIEVRNLTGGNAYVSASQMVA